MNKLPVATLCLLLISLTLFTSCLKKSDPDPLPVFKIGFVSGLGGLSDRGFNQNILTGVQQAANDFPVYCEVYEISTVLDIPKGIEYFRSRGINLIITAGFDASQATIAAATANPSLDFLILDCAIANPPANMLCAVFDVDQSSFPCGFLAAYWASGQNQVNPVTGFVAGPEITEIRQFSVSYAHGVEYFNTKYNQHVRSSGYFATSFNDTMQGAKLADSLLQQHASVIFAFAGRTGNGALYKAKEAGKWAIGVDVDQFISIPQVGSALLTSCIKELDVVVYGVIGEYSTGYFGGGRIIHGNLENGGVGMAPFHDFETSIPDSIKMALENIKTGIKTGTIKTGWPE